MQELRNAISLMSAAATESNFGSPIGDIPSQEATESQSEEYQLSKENSINGEPPR